MMCYNACFGVMAVGAFKIVPIVIAESKKSKREYTY